MALERKGYLRRPQSAHGLGRMARVLVITESGLQALDGVGIGRDISSSKGDGETFGRRPSMATATVQAARPRAREDLKTLIDQTLFPGERRAAAWLIRRLGRSGAATVIVRDLAAEVGLSHTTFGAAMRKLSAAGAIRTTPRGQAGTLIEILDPHLRNALGP